MLWRFRAGVKKHCTSLRDRFVTAFVEADCNGVNQQQEKGTKQMYLVPFCPLLYLIDALFYAHVQLYHRVQNAYQVHMVQMYPLANGRSAERKWRSGGLAIKVSQEGLRRKQTSQECRCRILHPAYI
jgi:hypothetical protein